MLKDKVFIADQHLSTNLSNFYVSLWKKIINRYPYN